MAPHHAVTRCLPRYRVGGHAMHERCDFVQPAILQHLIHTCLDVIPEIGAGIDYFIFRNEVEIRDWRLIVWWIEQGLDVEPRSSHDDGHLSQALRLADPARGVARPLVRAVMLGRLDDVHTEMYDAGELFRSRLGGADIKLSVNLPAIRRDYGDIPACRGFHGAHGLPRSRRADDHPNPTIGQNACLLRSTPAERSWSGRERHVRGDSYHEARQTGRASPLRRGDHRPSLLPCTRSSQPVSRDGRAPTASGRQSGTQEYHEGSALRRSADAAEVPHVR